MTEVLKASAVRKTYGANLALNGVSLDIQEGEVVGLLGPNGAGKTTLSEACAGYRSIDSGEIKVFGRDPDDRAVKQRIGVMLQEGGIYPALKVREVVEAFASFYPTSLATGGLLTRIGLSDKGSSLVKSLSGGQKQRLSLALALVGEPQLAFLDEPTSGMDPQARIAAHIVIRELADAGASVFMTTHLIEEAEAICDRIAVINKGKLLAIGSPSSLAGPPSLGFSVRGDFDLGELSRSIKRKVVQTSEGDFVAEGEVDPQVVAEVAVWFASKHLLCHQITTRGSLKDAYLRMVEVDSP